LFDSMTVGENIAFPLREHTKLSEKEIKRIVKEKLELVGLSGIEDKMPSELSGGMKKRVGLARAIVLEPEIVIYDEPTTGLDPISSASIYELILEMEKDIYILSQEDTIENVATVMIEKGIYYFPVVENKAVVGIVTKKDIVRAIAQRKIW